MDETYTTPEGFELYKPLLMPDARSFSDVLTADKAWNYSTMNHHDGRRQAETPDEIELPNLERVVMRFCAVRHMEDRGSMLVTPTPATLDLLASDHFAFFDRISFEAIRHEANDRVLIVAQASGILASRWLAYVAADSVPTLAELDQ